jgi:hypothetical protein
MSFAGSWTEEPGDPIIIRGYTAKFYEDLIASYYKEALELHGEGYEPASQHYVDGEWGFWRVALATVLIPFLIGILLWLDMLSRRPVGTLTVTYLLRDRA